MDFVAVQASALISFSKRTLVLFVLLEIKFVENGFLTKFN
jgi:hypothetical protein